MFQAGFECHKSFLLGVSITLLHHNIAFQDRERRYLFRGMRRIFFRKGDNLQHQPHQRYVTPPVTSVDRRLQ